MPASLAVEAATLINPRDFQKLSPDDSGGIFGPLGTVTQNADLVTITPDFSIYMIVRDKLSRDVTRGARGVPGEPVNYYLQIGDTITVLPEDQAVRPVMVITSTGCD